jgi:hypothetical protein
MRTDVKPTYSVFIAGVRLNAIVRQQDIFTDAIGKNFGMRITGFMQWPAGLYADFVTIMNLQLLSLIVSVRMPNL